jgi:hypothetical protein
MLIELVSACAPNHVSFLITGRSDQTIHKRNNALLLFDS